MTVITELNKDTYKGKMISSVQFTILSQLQKQVLWFAYSQTLYGWLKQDCNYKRLVIILHDILDFLVMFAFFNASLVKKYS
jgi:hypothetical protein